jgi:chorismate mutase/prephenate dehydratase
MFFVDFNGHTEEQNISNMLENLKRSCMFVKNLGSYPKS